MQPVAPIDYITDFVALGVPAPLIKVLADRDVLTAFPIQSATLPDSLLGHDVLGRGKTGSGKTIAFALPIVARLAASGRRRESGRPRALILVPTRELANQVMTSLKPLAEAMSLRVATVYGGVGQGPQVSALAPRRRHRRRLPRPPRRPHRPAALPPRRGRESPCSTRPTTWPTSASCPA